MAVEKTINISMDIEIGGKGHGFCKKVLFIALIGLCGSSSDHQIRSDQLVINPPFA